MASRAKVLEINGDAESLNLHSRLGISLRVEMHEGQLCVVRRIPLARLIEFEERIEVRKEAVFSSRESQVLKMVVEGKANKEIAGALNISVRTVKLYVSSLLSKAGMRSRTELAASVLGARMSLRP